MYLRTQDREKTAWRVRCPHHGPVFLTEEEYTIQMRNPDCRWKCPAFAEGNPKDFNDVSPGVCGAQAGWDDDWYELWLEENEPA